MKFSTSIVAFLTLLLLASARAAPPDALSNPHASPDCGITRANVDTLEPAWWAKTDAQVSHVALIDGDDLFFGDWGGTVYKLDRRDGKPRWKKKIHTPQSDWPWHGFAGTGVLTSDLYIVASVEGPVYGIDRESGEVKWKTDVAADPEAGSLARLLHHDGVVYIGLESVEEPLSKDSGFKVDFQGAVLALDARSGKELWRTPLAEGPTTGVAVWSGFALDPELGLLYFTTGNTYTGEKAAPFSDAIVAVRADTGKVQWSRQTYEHDIWLPKEQIGPDYDFAAAPQLLDVKIDGATRPLVIAGQKSGMLWAFDRATGERVWAASVGYGGVEGGFHAEASIGRDAIYAWSNNGYFHKKPPGEHHITVKKLDAATGRPLWVVNEAQPAGLFSAGLLVDGAYLVPSIDGTIVAYDAEDGKKLHRMKSQPTVTGALAASAGLLYAPCATPKMFKWLGDVEGNGMHAYRVRPKAD